MFHHNKKTLNMTSGILSANRQFLLYLGVNKELFTLSQEKTHSTWCPNSDTTKIKMRLKENARSILWVGIEMSKAKSSEWNIGDSNHDGSKLNTSDMLEFTLSLI